MKKRVGLFVLVCFAACGFFFSRYIVAYMALSAGERIMYVSNSYYRNKITPKVILAKACLAHYRELDATTDAEAEAEAKRRIPRFFYHFYNGYAAGITGTGLPNGCDPDILNENEPGWQMVNQYNSVTGDGDYSADILEQCDMAAQRYAGQFNKHLAAARPDRVPFACAHRPTPGETKQMLDHWRTEQKKQFTRAHSASPIVVRRVPAVPPLPPVVAPPPILLPPQ